MDLRFALVAALVGSSFAAAPARADSAVGWRSPGVATEGELPPYTECVPFAREASGIRIYGDALSWWDQAKGRYQRGHRPQAGSVMAVRPFGPLQLGHVALVSRVVDSRTVLLRHANWSPVGGQRGQVEDNVRAVDVSARNDWSEVRIWYAPSNDLGETRWPVAGFIYPGRAEADAGQAPAAVQPVKAAPRPAGGADPIGAIIASF